MTNPLAVDLAGIKLSNPTMLASGVMGVSALLLKQVADAGAGAVVTKSFGLESRNGYSNPTVVQVENGLLNSIGLPNPSIKYFAQDIDSREQIREIKIPIIISIYASSIKEWGKVTRIADKIEIDGLELNLSCPHVEETGAVIGQHPKLLENVVREVKKQTKKPVIVKLTANTSSIVELSKAAEKGGADAVTAINTLKAMKIDIETGKPILGKKVGGLSGPAIKPVAVRCVYEIFESVNLPIIGCGGIETWKDAVEFMEAGASAFQIGTGIAYRGLSLFKQISKGIKKFLEKKGYDCVKDIVGLSHRN